jgi:hypothetical protein
MKYHILIAAILSGMSVTQASKAELITDNTVGLKLLVGADYWSKPSNLPGYQWPGFQASASGFGYGALAYYEFRLQKFFGIEAAVAYQHGSFHRNVTFTYSYQTPPPISETVTVVETVSTNALRLPILAKAVIPLGITRTWLGVGPEFTLVQWSAANAAQMSGGTNVIEAGLFTTRNPTPTFATFGLGLVFELPRSNLEISTEFRASKNLSQPSAWSNRVALVMDAVGYDIRAESSWVGRFGIGVGYRF